MHAAWRVAHTHVSYLIGSGVLSYDAETDAICRSPHDDPSTVPTVLYIHVGVAVTAFLSYVRFTR